MEWIRRVGSVLSAVALVAALGVGCGDDDEVVVHVSGDAESYDLVIRNGRVIDPLTATDQPGAVGIQDGKIAAVATDADEIDAMAEGAARVIDVAGQVVSPGFINTHTHEGIIQESMQVYVKDGITTWIGGNCGSSDYSLADYFAEIEAAGLYNNYGSLTGINTLRTEIGLDKFQEATPEQIEQMVPLLTQDMVDGSFGVSFGAFYSPGCTYEEMVATAAEAERLGGMAATHMRDNIYNLWDIMLAMPLDEALDTARETGVPYLISHLTDVTYGRGTTGFALGVISKALHEEGLNVAVDVIGADSFPNDFFTIARYGQIPLKIIMAVADVKPEDFQTTEDVYVDGELYLPAYSFVESIEQAQYIMDMIVAGRAESPSLICYILRPANTMLALAEPFVFVGNDGYVRRDPDTQELLQPHPRAAGSFARMIGHWARDNGVLNLMQALYKATAAPALWFGLDKKGRLQAGCDADIVIFDPNTIIDTAYCAPGHYLDPPDGISYVIVNGEVVVDHKELTGAKSGQVIRRTWEVPGWEQGLEIE
ncbi:MAG: amidohydrolase family protein [bacterium]